MLSLLRVLVGVFVGATVAGFADPAHWTLTLLGGPRLHYAVVLVLLGAVAGWFGRWALTGLAVLAAVLNLAVVAPLWTGARAQADAANPTIDVVMFNTKIRSDQDAVAEWLQREQPDVAVLTATTSSWDETMRNRSGMEVAVSQPPGIDLELLVLTAHEPRGSAILEWGRDGRDRAVEVVVGVEGESVRVLGLHPVSPVGIDRAVRRDTMLRHAAAWAASTEQPAVVAGDLNAVPWSTAFRRLLDEGGLVNSLEGHGVQPSWPAPVAWVGVPLDHVLHSPELSTVERTLGPSFGSNHRLVHARLELTPRGSRD